MGAWIEIEIEATEIDPNIKSHPTMGAWIEICSLCIDSRSFSLSHPTMGAWIEIYATFNSTSNP